MRPESSEYFAGIGRKELSECQRWSPSCGLVSLQLAEVQREGKLLLVREVLAVKDEHGVLVHPRIDRRHLLATHRPGDVNPRHLSRELISQRADRYGHLARSFQLQTLHRLTKPLNG